METIIDKRDGLLKKSLRDSIKQPVSTVFYINSTRAVNFAVGHETPEEF